MSSLIDATPLKKKTKREKVGLPISLDVWAISHYLVKDIYEGHKVHCREKNEESRPHNVKRRRRNQAPKGQYYLCVSFSICLIYFSQSYVNACGVRKIWSKEFQGLDRPSQQIQRLKAILVELGMNGRPSMEKAKEIKEKRELAKELGDWSSSLHYCHVVNHQTAQKMMYALLNKLLWDDLLVRDPTTNQIRIETKFLQRRIRFVYSLFVFSYLNVHSWTERGSEKYHGILG